MSQTIPRRQKLNAVSLVTQGQPRQDVVDSTGISLSTIYRATKNQRVHGDIEAPHKKSGRKPKMSQSIIDVLTSSTFNDCLLCQGLLHQVMEVPDAQLSEYANEIFNRYDIQISKSRVSTILKNLGFSRKKVFFLEDFLIVVGKRGSTKVSRASRCVVPQASRLEC